MRYFIIVIGLCLCMFFGFLLWPSTTQTLPYDDEQQALDEQITIKISHVVAQNTPKGLAAQHFANLVEQKSNGHIDVQVFANAVLYNDETELAALQHNDVQMIMPTVSKMTTEVPAWAVLDIPYLFHDAQHVERFFTSEEAQQLLAMSSVDNVIPRAFWANGFKHFLSELPITKIDDFQQQYVRIMDSHILKEQFTLLDATPITLAFQDIFSNAKAQTYTIQENTFSNIASKNIDGFQPYVTVSAHGLLSYVVLINEDFYTQLPPDVQQIIDEALHETTAWHFAQSAQLNKQAYATLQQRAEISTLSDIEKRRFQQRMAPIYEAYANTHYKQIIDTFAQ
ncbi:DctP family TRAP transporter solute-binding subunit [Caryophanon tenue]|nr:DctP family TRAP transporter solute-binding subunit [Caryophanon tenue]